MKSTIALVEAMIEDGLIQEEHKARVIAGIHQFVHNSMQMAADFAIEEANKQLKREGERRIVTL